MQKLLIPGFWFLSLILSAQPAGYYITADGKSGTVLQQALHDIIDNHTVLTYSELWTAFQKTDKKSDSYVWDMYSDIPGGTAGYVFVFGQNQCGNYSKEGDCYNREHSFPKSWFNDLSPMYTDLNHLVPTDGWVNNKRGNYPFGVTNSPSWTSTNGSKLGPSSYPGYSGIIFEPINNYKGDFARIYFYMAVRYFGEDAGWLGSDMVTGSQPKAWAMNMLMEWNINDPVSQKEKDRNDSIFVLQGNRNPFIDTPIYASLIWGSTTGSYDFKNNSESFGVYPNPASDELNINYTGNFTKDMTLTISDMSGRIVLEKDISGAQSTIDITTINSGIYIISLNTAEKTLRVKVIVSK
jgi:endonuclease I